MVLIEMQPLNVNDTEHLKFTYDLLVERFSKKYIEIEFLNKKTSLPSFTDHVNYLKENISKYVFFYIITYNKIPFCEIFVDSKLECGIYQSVSALKLLKRKYRKLERKKGKVLVYEIFHTILKKHKADVPYLIAKINPLNKLSLSGVVNLDFKKAYECYILNNN